jgi:hypothetical protein
MKGQSEYRLGMKKDMVDEEYVEWMFILEAVSSLHIF